MLLLSFDKKLDLCLSWIYELRNRQTNSFRMTTKKFASITHLNERTVLYYFSKLSNLGFIERLPRIRGFENGKWFSLREFNIKLQQPWIPKAGLPQFNQVMRSVLLNVYNKETIEHKLAVRYSNYEYLPSRKQMALDFGKSIRTIDYLVASLKKKKIILGTQRRQYIAFSEKRKNMQLEEKRNKTIEIVKQNVKMEFAYVRYILDQMDKEWGGGTFMIEASPTMIINLIKDEFEPYAEFLEKIRPEGWDEALKRIKAKVNMEKHEMRYELQLAQAEEQFNREQALDNLKIINNSK